MLAILLLMMTTPEPPPRGVNNAVIGTAEEFTVKGPTRICLNEGAIDLKPGETSYLGYIGVHSTALRIQSTDGEFKVSEGEAWSEPRGGRRIDATIRRFGSGAKTRYAVYGRPEFSPDRDVLLTWVDGTGDAVKDLERSRRVIPVLQDKTTCRHRFLYGMFPEFEAAQP